MLMSTCKSYHSHDNALNDIILLETSNVATSWRNDSPYVCIVFGASSAKRKILISNCHYFAATHGWTWLRYMGSLRPGLRIWSISNCCSFILHEIATSLYRRCVKDRLGEIDALGVDSDVGTDSYDKLRLCQDAKASLSHPIWATMSSTTVMIVSVG